MPSSGRHDILATLQKLRLVKCLGKDITHHIIRADEKHLHFIQEAQRAREMQPTVEVHCTLRCSWITNDVIRGLVVNQTCGHIRPISP